MSEPILYTKKLTKYFGKLAANSEIDISVKRGEIHAIAGENGAGKSTLMKMLFGIYTPSSGEIVVDGRKMSRWNPTLAREMGIGMVFQDFRIVPAFTVLENIFLTLKHWGKVINRKRLREEILQKAREYHLDVDPDIEVWKLDLGQRQHVEILKILLDPQTRIMIFDEPTSVLAPHEIVSFLKMLRDFREKGFPVAGCPWRNFEAMKPMADFVARVGGFGYIQTTWHHLRGNDWVKMYRYGASAAWGTAVRGTGQHGPTPQFDTEFANALRFVGHDMKATDSRDTGTYEYQIPPAWWPED